MQELGYSFKWDENDALHFTTPTLDAIKTVVGPNGPATPVFFNQLCAQALANAAEFKSVAGDNASESFSASAVEMAPPFITFGDGSPVPLAPLRWANDLVEKSAVDIVWQAGDVALLDNFLVMHARREFEGPRRVLASLVK